MACPVVFGGLHNAKVNNVNVPFYKVVVIILKFVIFLLFIFFFYFGSHLSILSIFCSFFVNCVVGFLNTTPRGSRIEKVEICDIIGCYGEGLPRI